MKGLLALYKGKRELRLGVGRQQQMISRKVTIIERKRKKRLLAAPKPRKRSVQDSLMVLSAAAVRRLADSHDYGDKCADSVCAEKVLCVLLLAWVDRSIIRAHSTLSATLSCAASTCLSSQRAPKQLVYGCDVQRMM